MLEKMDASKNDMIKEIKEEVNESVEGQGVEDSNLVTDHLVHKSYLYFFCHD